jgi:hypothetical protein
LPAWSASHSGDSRRIFTSAGPGRSPTYRAVFFTTPHFNGYAAVLVCLDLISSAALRDVLVESWLARAPARLAAEFLATAKKPRPRRG